MADNVTFQTTVATPPDGTVVAADDVSSVLYQRVKVDLGGDGAASPLVRGQQSDANSIPVTLSSELATILTAIQTAVQIIDNIVSGSEAQVDVLTMPAITGTVDLGATDNAVLDAIAASAALSDDVVYADDAAFTLTSSKVAAVGAVRDDALTSLSATEGDVVPLRVDANGAVHVVSGTQQGYLQTLQSIVYSEDSGHSSGHSGAYVHTVRTDTAAARGTTDGDYQPFITDSNGRLHVIEPSAAASLTALQTLDNAISGNEMQVDVVAALPAGSALIGDVGIQGRATGGTSTFRSIDLDESEEEVKATPGTIYSIAAFNRTAAPLYLKLYNLTAANTTVGSSTPTHTYVVPANADSDGAGFLLSVPQGIAFSTAISAAVTTGVADADTGAPGANDCVVNIQYV